MIALVLLVLATVAPAAEGIPRGQILDLYAAADHLVLRDDPPVWLEDPIRVEDGPFAAVLRRGYYAVVWSGPEGDPAAQEPVGVVWVDGAGTLDLSFPDSGDALRFAQKMAAQGHDEADLAPVAHGEAPFSTQIGRGVLIGTTPTVEELVGRIRQERAVEGADELDLVVEVVAERRPHAEALADARRFLRQRLAAFDDARIDVADRIATERLRQVVTGGQQGFALLDLRTADAFPEEVSHSILERDFGHDEPKSFRRVDDRWVTALVDETGEHDPGRRVDVFTLHAWGEDHVHTTPLTGIAFEVGDDGVPRASRGLVADLAETTIDIHGAVQGGNLLEVRVESTLTLQARGETGVFRMRIPLPAVPRDRVGRVRFTAELPDGRPVLVQAPEWRQSHATFALPEPVADGETVTLRTSLETWWVLGHQHSSGQLDLGTTTGLQYYLPRPAGASVGNPWHIRTRVGILDELDLTAAVAGRTERTWSERGRTWVEAISPGVPAHWPAVAVGRYRTAIDPPHEDLPGVRVHLMPTRDRVLESFAPEVRRQVLFYHGYLPTFPWQEVEVFEGPAAPGGYAWVAAHGTVKVQKAVIGTRGELGHGGLRNKRPHLENGILAHEVAHQYWGHLAPPHRPEDLWIAETLAEGFACMYLAAAFEAQDCKVRMKDHRRTWERGPFRRMGLSGSLSYNGASPVRSALVYQYGPYAFFEMLQRRIGTAPFFAALDVLLREHAHEPLTEERLQAYFEAASGQDLDDFFAFWVTAGSVPRARLEYDLVEGERGRVRVVGEVTADVPFGTFLVPVVITDAIDREFVEWVEVTDGEGTLASPPVAGPRAKVELDPEGWTLLRKRRDKRVRR